MRVRSPSFWLLVYVLLTILSSEKLVGADKVKKLVKYGFAFAPFAGMVGYGHGYGSGHGRGHDHGLGRSSGGKKKKKKKKGWLSCQIKFSPLLGTGRSERHLDGLEGDHC